jgi:DNA (cytosine-5)-methyltransferase 1
MEAVEVVRPLAFIMENVPHLALSPRWHRVILDLIYRAHVLGYTAHLMVLDAADYGVAQHRERMFLIGLPSGVPFAEPALAGRRVTCGEALRALPAFGDVGNSQACTARIVPARKPVLRGSAYAGMLFNGAGRPLNLRAPSTTLPATMGGNRTPIVDTEELRLPVKMAGWAETYYARLRQGGEPFTEVPPEAGLRRLTVEEAAAIQSFPRGMRFQGPQTARFRQVGNAVPPLLAWHVAQAVTRSLGH